MRLKIEKPPRMYLPCIVFFIFLSSVFANSPDSLGIALAPGKPHQYIFTNKVAGFWYGETQRPHQNAYQGYTAFEQRYINDYSLVVNGKELSRAMSESIVLYPDRLVRRYAPLTETVLFVDGWNALIVQVESRQPLRLRWKPTFDVSLGALNWRYQESSSCWIARADRVAEGRPRYLALAVVGESKTVQAKFEKAKKVKKKKRGKKTPPGLPDKLSYIEIEDLQNVYLAIVIDADSAAVLAKVKRLQNAPEEILSARTARIARLLKQVKFKSPDARINKAYAWAAISLSDLVVEQMGPGIWAGLPWFNNYWGRDSFISLPGALLVAGQFESARDILLRFSALQNTDKRSPYYGRIPNRVKLNETIYNTADGTPWFVRACWEYVRYSGDTQFINRIFPVVQTAMEGALQNYVDAYGFLYHGDAETWMDAVGSDGPWSPRGNRAVEVQALWMEQIRISRTWAEQLGYSRWAGQWKMLEERLQHNFQQQFWDSQRGNLYDHLNADNSPDLQIRPNALFALTIPQSPLLTSEQKLQVLQTIAPRLLFPYGVASLAEDDPNFHPYHHYPPYYVPDAAYHNGLIWTWLNGPAISALTPYYPQAAYQLQKEASRQIIENDAVGSLSELLETWPRAGETEPVISGTVSQAWSLAEYLRNWQEDLLGIQPNAVEGYIRIAPHLPEEWLPLKFRFRYASQWIDGVYEQNGSRFSLTLNRPPGSEPCRLRLSLPGQTFRTNTTIEWTGESLTAVLNDAAVTVNGAPVQMVEIDSLPALPALALANPVPDMSIPALQGPRYPLISPQEATQKPGGRIVFDLKDPANDDRGPNGKYQYPTHPQFKEGIFDLRRVKIRQDNRYFYFEIELRDMVNPGLKPESGFQHVCIAITLNFEKFAGVRSTKLGMNANFSVPIEYAYNFVIYLGNGYRIVNSRGKVIAEYRPVDTEHPLGFAEDKKIRFSVPVKYLSDRRLKNAVVLAGGQDDHGGGGVGEFRDVRREAGEWFGGGGERPSGNPNIYDLLFMRR